jgi:hypothetical protein
MHERQVRVYIDELVLGRLMEVERHNQFLASAGQGFVHQPMATGSGFTDSVAEMKSVPLNAAFRRESN